MSINWESICITVGYGAIVLIILWIIACLPVILPIVAICLVIGYPTRLIFEKNKEEKKDG